MWAKDKILKNKKAGLHTLCLLDIKVKEQTVPRFASVKHSRLQARCAIIYMYAQSLSSE